MIQSRMMHAFSYVLPSVFPNLEHVLSFSFFFFYDLDIFEECWPVTLIYDSYFVSSWLDLGCEFLRDTREVLRNREQHHINILLVKLIFSSWLYLQGFSNSVELVFCTY